MTQKKNDTMKTLFILNDAPYGSERSYNGLRLAGTLSKAEGEEVKLFLIGDAASCAKGGQKVPEGFYNIQLMLGRVLRNRAEVGVCGTCMDARGITDPELVDGTRRSTLAELTSWTQWADKVIVF
ncbi:MAG: DsrE family protein [Burkholderiales bacterium]